MPINRHDDSMTVIYKNDKYGNRDLSASQLNIYKGNDYIVDNDPSRLRVAVQFQGGQASVEVMRSELLEALGITPQLLEAGWYAFNVMTGVEGVKVEDLSVELNTLRALLEAIA